MIHLNIKVGKYNSKCVLYVYAKKNNRQKKTEFAHKMIVLLSFILTLR